MKSSPTIIQWGPSVATASPVFPDGKPQTGRGELIQLSCGTMEDVFFAPAGDVGVDRAAVCLQPGLVVVVLEGLGTICGVESQRSWSVPLCPIMGLRSIPDALLAWSYTNLASISAEAILLTDRLVCDSLEILSVSKNGSIKAKGWLHGQDAKLVITPRDFIERRTLRAP